MSKVKGELEGAKVQERLLREELDDEKGRRRATTSGQEE